MTYVLPEYLNWLGWVGAALIILTTAYLFYRQRKKKDSDPRTMWWIGREKFSSVWLPLSIGEKEGNKIAWNLENIVSLVNRQADRLYGRENDKYWPVDSIHLADAEPHKKHPHVMWSPGAHKIYLRLQKAKFYWFARECHNIYRWQMHGIEFMYTLKDEADRIAAEAVEDWIEGILGHLNG